MTEIRAENLTKAYRVAVKDPGFRGTLRHFFRRAYREVRAVHDVSFHVAPGEVVGFLGANGAGKTTTLKMLTGLIHPTAGDAEVAGFVPYRRRHAFLKQITLLMGQKQQLIWDLPALESLRINAAVYDLSPRTFRERVDELAEMLHLDVQLSKPVRKLSQGERMKVELMAALLHRPRILFLDEPTLGLDINAQAAVREFLRQYNRRFGATILLTSHYMADITALCPRVLLVDRGRLVYDGSLEGLVERLAPHREVSVEFSHPVSREHLEPFGEVASVDETAASLLVQRDALTPTLDRLLDAFDVADLTVTDPPVEKLVGQLFKEGGGGVPAFTDEDASRQPLRSP